MNLMLDGTWIGSIVVLFLKYHLLLDNFTNFSHFSIKISTFYP